jgi:hypothetical protein
MTDIGKTNGSTTLRDRRLLLVMIALGLAAVSTLIVVPFETILPPQVKVPRILLLIQPALVVVACAALGWWAAPRTALGAPVLSAALDKRDWQPALLRGIPAALLTAAGVALILMAFGRATQGLTDSMPQLDLPLLARLGYGGVGEEIIARWGLLTGLMALAMRLRQSSTFAFWLANSVSALLFALGHFGVLFAMLPNPPLWLLGAVLLGNFVPAMAFGWLYRKFGIESAMIAHGGAHALFCAAAASGLVNW